MKIQGRTVETALAEAEQRYADRRPQSFRRFQSATRHMPGGNTRSVIHFSPFPFAVAKAKGAYLEDLDGHIYADFLGEFSAGIYGHSHPAIIAAAQEALADGLSFGAPNKYEAEFAEVMCDRFPSCEMVRFCNSGTEANLMAIATARAVTGRSKLMVMNGGYHGSVLKFAGGGAVTNVPYEFVVGTYNDLQNAVQLLERESDNIAALLVEPLMGSSGCIEAEPSFLKGLRDATARLGVILIFDEVMTSRLSLGGLQERLNIIPDMTTFGKYLGGGFSFGAFGGKREIMSRYDPQLVGGLAHAGTFNNNVMSMKAGLTGLRDVYGEREIKTLNERGDWFLGSLNEIAKKRQTAMQIIGRGSMMAIHFQRETIARPSDIEAATSKRALLQLTMLEAGYYIARRGFMALSLALEDRDYHGFLKSFDAFAEEHGDMV
jgi:glutamate-1-semialdehyde 2,1-aminomutase